MARSFQLQIETPVRFTGTDNREVFRVKGQILASAGWGSAVTKIFAHQRSVLNPVEGTYVDEFVMVCGPYELQLYPEDAPVVGPYPYFRKSTFDFLTPGVKEADKAVETLKKLVGGLCTRADELDNLVIATYDLP